jgi:hypothetical protein
VPRVVATVTFEDLAPEVDAEPREVGPDVAGIGIPTIELPALDETRTHELAQTGWDIDDETARGLGVEITTIPLEVR